MNNLEQPGFIPIPYNIPITYWACPSTCSIDSRLSGSIQTVPCIYPFICTHAHTDKYFFFPFSFKNLNYEARFILRRPTSESGATIVTVLQPAPFLKCDQAIIQWYESPIKSRPTICHIRSRNLTVTILYE